MPEYIINTAWLFMQFKEFIWGYISLKKREILGVQQFSETPDVRWL